MSSHRELAAVHEAGHAAAIHALQELVGFVAIGSHGSGVTRNRHSLFFGTTITRADELRICIAGPLAESWYCRYSVEEVLEQQTRTSNSDGSRVRRELNGESLSGWVTKTERALRGYGRHIERLAEALLKCGEMPGREAATILSGRG